MYIDLMQTLTSLHICRLCNASTHYANNRLGTEKASLLLPSLQVQAVPIQTPEAFKIHTTCALEDLDSPLPFKGACKGGHIVSSTPPPPRPLSHSTHGRDVSRELSLYLCSELVAGQHHCTAPNDT